MNQAATPSVLAGLIGSGIQASRTPAMHEHEGDAQGMRYLYRLIDIDVLDLDINALPRLLEGAQQCGFTGLNITFPCKQAVIPLLDELSDEARGIGAVNTVVFKDGKRIGHNTDCLGLPKVSSAVGPAPKSGADGCRGRRCSRGSCAVERGRRMCLTVFEVDPQRAQGLVDNLNSHFGAGRAQVGLDLPAAMG